MRRRTSGGMPDAGVRTSTTTQPDSSLAARITQRAALGHGVHRVLDQAHQGVAQLEGIALDGRQRLHVLSDGDDDAAALGLVAPARRGHLQRLRDDGGQPDRAEGRLGLARDELLQPSDGRGGFESHVADRDEPPPGRLRLGFLQHELRVGEDGGQGVVEVVGEPAHGLAQGAAARRPGARRRVIRRGGGQSRVPSCAESARTGPARPWSAPSGARCPGSLRGRRTGGDRASPPRVPDGSTCRLADGPGRSSLRECYRFTSWATRSRWYVASPKVNSDPFARLK